MGIIRDYMNQTRKPEGFLGNMMITGMNFGHAGLAKWGMSKLNVKDPETIADLGCGGGSNMMLHLDNRTIQTVVTIFRSSLLQCHYFSLRPSLKASPTRSDTL
jgi:hypothetical protein